MCLWIDEHDNNKIYNIYIPLRISEWEYDYNNTEDIKDNKDYRHLVKFYNKLMLLLVMLLFMLWWLIFYTFNIINLIYYNLW